MSNILRFPHLHGLVYIVADKPTKDNISPKTPLVGTQSYKTLLCWLADMDIDITRVRLYNQIDDPFGNIMSKVTLNKAIELDQIKVLALGQKAGTYLNKVGIDEYFLLPHPSPANRRYHQSVFLNEKLASCRKYIYG